MYELYQYQWEWSAHLVHRQHVHRFAGDRSRRRGPPTMRRSKRNGQNKGEWIARDSVDECRRRRSRRSTCCDGACTTRGSYVLHIRAGNASRGESYPRHTSIRAHMHRHYVSDAIVLWAGAASSPSCNSMHSCREFLCAPQAISPDGARWHTLAAREVHVRRAHPSTRARARVSSESGQRSNAADVWMFKFMCVCVKGVHIWHSATLTLNARARAPTRSRREKCVYVRGVWKQIVSISACVHVLHVCLSWPCHGAVRIV